MTDFNFTYLDLVDSSIAFDPVMDRNFFHRDGKGYALFTSNPESEKFSLPGYEGQRCVIEIEMAKTLSLIQKELAKDGLGLKVYDAYRPQKTVNYFIKWMEEPDTSLAKKYHYPQEEKKLFHERSYLSRTSSHSLGTAVDVTIVDLNQELEMPSEDFLGLWDPESVDMGVGYLCFDERSWQSYDKLSSAQLKNRKLLRSLMLRHGFEDLETEFWHYYYKKNRNPSCFFSFDVRDDYEFTEKGYLIGEDKSLMLEKIP